VKKLAYYSENFTSIELELFYDAFYCFFVQKLKESKEFFNLKAIKKEFLIDKKLNNKQFEELNYRLPKILGKQLGELTRSGFWEKFSVNTYRILNKALI